MKLLQYTRAADGLRAASDWITPLLGKTEVFVAGATRAAADEFARGLGEAGSIGVHRMTLVQLAASLAARRMAELGLAPVTRLATEAIAARAIHKLYKAGKLEYFERVAKYPGFPAALATTLTDLRLAGARPADGDPRRLLAEYEKELKSRGLADLAQVFALAEVPGAPVLLLDAPTPSRAHRDFIEKLDGFAIQIAPADAGYELRKVLDHARAHVFSSERPAGTDADATFEFFSSPGEGLEAVEIARRIRVMRVPYDRVAILLRSPERYQFLMEEALRRAGVPAYFSRGSSRPDPAGRALLALLNCAAEGCSATRFAEYLSLGQVPEAPAEPEWTPPDDDMLPLPGADAGASPEREPDADGPAIATPIAWEKLLVDAAVIGGRERWIRRLRGLAEEFQLQLSTGPDERIERQLEKLRNLERFALPLIELLDALPHGADWGDWLQHLRRLAAASLRHPESVLAALAELEPMTGIGPVEIDEVLQVVSERMRFLRREPPHRRYGRVFVGSIEEARGRSFDTVFLPGLAEGVFPRRSFEDPLLLDKARRELADALPLRENRSEDERTLLRIALGAAAERFIFSYPSMDLAQGRPRVPSLYALELIRAVEGRVPKLQEFERRSNANAQARLGWPAPRDAAHAIDDAEYDLAWHYAHANVKSSSSYLIAANPFLAESLRARIRRWDKPHFTISDGLVTRDTATHDVLHARRLSAKAYSPSALQQFASCPYKFYLYGIFGLREREETAALEQMDPLTRGALFHAVQFEFLRDAHYADLDSALKGLDASLEKVTAAYEERLAPAIARVWLNEIEDLRTDLRGWLRIWFQTREEWEPIHFEFAFGLRKDDAGGHDAASREEPAVLGDGTLVRGSIDLIERHRTREVLRVTDHKTGKPPAREPTYVGGGAVLQPALYALAAENLLGQTVESGRLFYCTQRGGFNEYTIGIARARPWFEEALRIIDDAIESGFLPAAPQKDACGVCDYKAVCGPYEEARVQRWKEKDSLDALVRIRNMA